MMGAARALPAPKHEDAAVRAEMKALVKAIARDGDAAAVERLCSLAQRHPLLAQRVIGCNLQRHTREFLAAMLFDREEDRAERDALLARLEVRACELAGPGASVEVKACAAAAAYEEAVYSLVAMTASRREEFSQEHPRVTLRRGASLRRYLYSLRTLVEVKRLQRPAIVAAAIHVGGTGNGRNGSP
jgi:hypothetical protein